MKFICRKCFPCKAKGNSYILVEKLTQCIGSFENENVQKTICNSCPNEISHYALKIKCIFVCVFVFFFLFIEIDYFFIQLSILLFWQSAPFTCDVIRMFKGNLWNNSSEIIMCVDLKGIGTNFSHTIDTIRRRINFSATYIQNVLKSIPRSNL